MSGASLSRFAPGASAGGVVRRAAGAVWRWILVAIGEAPAQRRADDWTDGYRAGLQRGLILGYQRAREDHIRLITEGID